MDPEAIQFIVSYIKTEKFQADWNNVQCVLEAANMYNFSALVKCCIEFLRDNVDACNCLGIMNLAERLSLNDLFFR